MATAITPQPSNGGNVTRNSQTDLSRRKNTRGRGSLKQFEFGGPVNCEGDQIKGYYAVIQNYKADKFLTDAPVMFVRFITTEEDKDTIRDNQMILFRCKHTVGEDSLKKLVSLTPFKKITLIFENETGQYKYIEEPLKKEPKIVMVEKPFHAIKDYAQKYFRDIYASSNNMRLKYYMFFGRRATFSQFNQSGIKPQKDDEGLEGAARYIQIWKELKVPTRPVSKSREEWFQKYEANKKKMEEGDTSAKS